jgi:hypothetical protein
VRPSNACHRSADLPTCPARVCITSIGGELRDGPAIAMLTDWPGSYTTSPTVSSTISLATPA